jgi:hypothetical protein
MQIVNVFLGAIVLFFGRTLYWVFVGIVGFLLGMTLADQYLASQSEAVQFLAALAAGIIGAIVAVFVQRIAFALGGFFAGGYIALRIADHFGAQGDNNTIWFIIGGVIGAIVAAMLMDWAIILLSSLAGSAAILSGLTGINMDSNVRSILFLVLAIVGIVVQGRRIAPPVAVPVETR